MLDGVEVSGVQNNAIADTGIAGIVGLSEVSSILAQQSYYTNGVPVPIRDDL